MTSEVAQFPICSACRKACRVVKVERGTARKVSSCCHARLQKPKPLRIAQEGTEGTTLDVGPSRLRSVAPGGPSTGVNPDTEHTPGPTI